MQFDTVGVDKNLFEEIAAKLTIVLVQLFHERIWCGR